MSKKKKKKMKAEIKRLKGVIDRLVDKISTKDDAIKRRNDTLEYHGIRGGFDDDGKYRYTYDPLRNMALDADGIRKEMGVNKDKDKGVLLWTGRPSPWPRPPHND